MIVASATMDANVIKNFFEGNESRDANNDTAVIMSVQGRVHPVDIFYVKGTWKYMNHELNDLTKMLGSKKNKTNFVFIQKIWF